MSCGICRRSQKDGFRTVRCGGIDTVPECPTGEIPKLMPENAPFWELFLRMRHGLSFESAVTLYGVPAGQRPVLHDKLLALMDVLAEIRRERAAKGSDY